MDKKRRYTVVLFFILLGSNTYRLFALPTVTVYQIEAFAVPARTVRSVDDLVFSFIKELKNYTIVDLRTELAPETVSLDDATDFIFFCTLKTVDDGIQFELVLKGKEAQYTRLISKVYKTSNKILLESRQLITGLFDFSTALKTDAAEPETVTVEFELVETVDSLAGSWKGERGLDRIMILRGGRGLAVFSSGVSVSLECSIEDGYLLITQKGMMQPRQFLDLPDDIALQAAQQTEPPRWRFLVSADKKILSGTKTDAQINYTEDTITNISYATAYVQWLRD